MYEPQYFESRPETRAEMLAAMLDIDMDFAKFLEWTIAKEKIDFAKLNSPTDEDVMHQILRGMVWQHSPEEAALAEMRFPPGLANFARWKTLREEAIGNLRSKFAEEYLVDTD